MSYIALYRKWRPLVFEDVVEQEHVVKTLKYSVGAARIAHAYLFCGTRGTGKTTMAKIFSRAINCLNPRDGDPCNECEICKAILSGSILDVVEIDAASNNSVDNVREIRDEVIYAPSQAKYKVYIIDEVHMLSTGAFNALLKTLEEPPAHVVFILATTEPHKLPATILSRCQRFDFRRISISSIVGRIQRIAGSGGASVSEDAARLIARMSDGALRDAISILDQCMALGNREISYNDVLNVVGIVNDSFMSDMVDSICDRNINRILEQVERLVMDGKDITQFVSDLVLHYRNLLICKVTDKPEEIVEAGADIIEALKVQAGRLEQESIMLIIKELSALESSLKWATHPRILLEMSLIKLCNAGYSSDAGNVLERLALLEKKINSGDFAPRPAAGDAAKVSAAETPAVYEKSVQKKPASNEPAKTGGRVSGGKGLENWGEVLKELKGKGKMALYSALMDTKAVELDDKSIGMVFAAGGSFNKVMASRAENLELVQNILAQKLGRTVRVKCIDEEDLSQPAKGGAKEEKDDFLEKVQDIVSGRGAPLNVIDE